MVAVTHAIAESGADEASFDLLAEGLPEEGRRRLEQAYGLVQRLYAGRRLGTGEDTLRHALGTALIAASLKLDLDTRLAALLFAVHEVMAEPDVELTQRYGENVAALVLGLQKLNGLRLISRATVRVSAPDLKAQSEVLRKMVLALVEDIRVVLLRLASRTQTLRYFTDHPGEQRDQVARESVHLYAPLANRLGVWQLKWELEDLSFRFLEPAAYKRIAKMLDERRVEREQFIVEAVERVRREVAAAGIRAEVFGRPKHIYSIWNKMRGKRVDFSEVYDVRALRVLVDEVKDCYTVLGLVHQIWLPIPKEFDDYISHPKGNDYRSLHTAVMASDGRALEVQIRTWEMHRHAELGVAAHWRYKEAGPGARASGAYDDKIALLRSLLSWRDEVADAPDWLEQYKRAALDDTIYVITPQRRVIDLPRGATPVDFAYRVHTDLGHRCRGARVDGQLVPLNTRLSSGQCVEIITAKHGGPSRDWLNGQLGFVVTGHSRSKIKRWFAAREELESLSQGRAIVTRELQREGQTQANIDDLAHRLGLANADALYLAAARDDVGTRQLQIALRGEPAADGDAPEIAMHRSRAHRGKSQVLVVGMDRLLTQLGRCCKPAPPDEIVGFVTRGKGVSIHRVACSNIANMSRRNPERIISAAWGGAGESYYPVDIAVEASDRQGLLRDISDVLTKDRVNVTAVNTQSRHGQARLNFTVEVAGVAQLQKVLDQLKELPNVMAVRRR